MYLYCMYVTFVNMFNFKNYSHGTVAWMDVEVHRKYVLGRLAKYDTILIRDIVH